MKKSNCLNNPVKWFDINNVTKMYDFSFKGVILVQSIFSVLVSDALPPPHVVARTLGVQVSTSSNVPFVVVNFALNSFGKLVPIVFL